MPIKRYKLPNRGDSSKQALFDQASQESRRSIGVPPKKVESAKKTSSAQLGSTSNVVTDMLSFEWALKYQEDHKRTILYIGKTSDAGVISSS